LCKHHQLWQINNKQEDKIMAGSGNESAGDTSSGRTRWGRIYASVAVFTVVIILLLYVFAQHYSG